MTSRIELFVALVAVASGCGRRSPEAMSDTPPPPPSPPSPRASLDASLAPDAALVDAGAVAEAPTIDLGAGLVPVGFVPGRYASHIQVSTGGNHALNRVTEVATISFVLELGADGSATACRGWRYAMRNDGPDVHTQDDQEVQQGYRGRFEMKDGFAVIELALDEGVCAHHNQYREWKPVPLKVRAALVRPDGHATLREPALFCEWTADPPRTNPGAHRIPDLTKEGWFVLGSGNGLRAKITGKPSPRFAGKPTAVAIEVAPAPIAADAWKSPF
jgi:hypothetical protein